MVTQECSKISLANSILVFSGFQIPNHNFILMWKFYIQYIICLCALISICWMLKKKKNVQFISMDEIKWVLLTEE